jgi:hypothetical protein
VSVPPLLPLPSVAVAEALALLSVGEEPAVTESLPPVAESLLPEPVPLTPVPLSVAVAVAVPSVAEALALGSEVLVVCGPESLTPVVEVPPPLPPLVLTSPVLASTPIVVPPESPPELLSPPLELVSLLLSMGSQASPIPSSSPSSWSGLTSSGQLSQASPEQVRVAVELILVGQALAVVQSDEAGHVAIAVGVEVLRVEDRLAGHAVARDAGDAGRQVVEVVVTALDQVLPREVVSAWIQDRVVDDDAHASRKPGWNG